MDTRTGVEYGAPGDLFRSCLQPAGQSLAGWVIVVLFEADRCSPPFTQPNVAVTTVLGL